MEFEDYLVASGIAIEPEENPDYRDIINKYKASLKNNARVWFSMYIENRVQDITLSRWMENSKELSFLLISIQ